MSDFLVDLGANPNARKLITTLGLPIPLPKKLRRGKGPWEAMPLKDREVFVGAFSRGELVAAVAFIVILFKSLRGGSKRKAQAEATSAQEAAAERERPVEIDPEALAREQVEGLIQTDPERVGKILSRWAREDKLVGSGQ